MTSPLRVAVIGSGISGAVCASLLAAKGVSVTVFESGRGAGGRMAQRREVTEDGKELFFDHGAPYFTVENDEVKGVVESWEAQGIVAKWNERFGSFDKSNSKFDAREEETNHKYVGIPGMNSICKALCLQPGIQANFRVSVGNLKWLTSRNIWSLSSSNGQSLGDFDGVVASDKNLCTPRLAGVTGKPLPLDMSFCPELGSRLQHIPVRSCFSAMLAFSEPLTSVPVKGFSFKNSEVLNWAFCDSSKPGRSRLYSTSTECWVLHSTPEYAANIISQTGLQKLSEVTLAEVAEDLFREFATIGVNIPRPFFLKAHRWGSAFPTTCIGGDDKCLCEKDKRLVICGDFCSNASVEGGVLSGMRAASKFLMCLSPL